MSRQSTSSIFQIGVLALISATSVTIGHSLFFDAKADPRMLLQPWLLQNGFVQYVHIADEHAPLLPQLIAWGALLTNADMLLVVRVTHAITIAAAVAAVVSWVGIRYGWPAALASGLFFWGWSIYFGYSVLWHNLTLSLLSFFFFVVLTANTTRKSMKLMGIGLLSGIAILVKQHALLLVPVALLGVVWPTDAGRNRRTRSITDATLYVAGMLIGFSAYLAYYLASGGTLEAFYYWFFAFNLQSDYSHLGWLPPGSHDIRQIAPAFVLLLPFIAGFRRRQVDSALRRDHIFLLLLLLSSFIFQYPRYSVAHWAVALPFIAAISGIVCGELFGRGDEQSQWRPLYVAIVLLWFLQGFTHYWPYWQGERAQQIIRYDELKGLAELVSPHISEGETLLLVPNNEAVDNLYYLLQRQPPRYWVMHYSWFANDRTTAAWLATVDAEEPETLILFDQHLPMLAQWPQIIAYVHANYDTVATLTWDGYPVSIMERSD